MSRENIPSTKDDGRSSSSRKTPPDQGVRCPRCDSPNTKFCYYNNYSLSQPRHFCKTCRRYWTKGGALRNVPIGGGCRKNKKTRSSSSRYSGDNNSNNSSGSTSDLGGFKFFQGISPAMDFQIGGVSNFPKLYNPQLSQYNPIASNTNPCIGLETLGNSISSPLMGFNFPLPNVMKQGESSGYGLEGIEDQMGNSMNVHSNIASSIESLSSINQDLHWKLQQQRLGMLFGGGENNQKENPSLSLPIESINNVHKPQPIMFHNLEIAKNNACGVGESSRKEGGGGGDIATEWFFETNYAPMNNQNPTNNISNGNEGTSNWSGIQGWGDLNQYGALP